MTRPRWKSDLPFYSVQEALANLDGSALNGVGKGLVTNVNAQFIGTGVGG